MGKYAYKLYKQPIERETIQKRYRYSELSKMTTYQLKEICHQEKLIKHVLDPLNQEELIHLIMRYRGKEEASYIRKFQEEGIERLENFLKKVDKKIQHDKVIQVPAKRMLYENLSVEIFDNYKISGTESLTEGNLLLVDEAYHICTLFNLIQMKDEQYYLIKDQVQSVNKKTQKQYYLLYFESSESELIYNLYYDNLKVLPQHIKFYKVPLLDLQIKKIEETTRPLVIDFGSSNTTAGIYDGQKGIQMVQMVAPSEEKLKTVPIIPSVIGIKAIEEESIQYVFGYEAIKLSHMNYKNEETHIFYDIKRWMSDCERMEKIQAVDGSHTWIKRENLIKAFLEYIIRIAEQRFKCHFKSIHLLAPVRQKGKFQKVFAKLLPEYDIACSIDEGVAVLFGTITEIIEKQKYEENKWYQALVIDCGGGTTDLTSCKFKISNHRVAYHIDLQTAYENGDTNFGGNNLTFRIMQLLKVKLVRQKQNQDTYITWEEDGFRTVDEKGKKFVYDALEKAYEEAEQILPTKFKAYEDRSGEDYFKVKSNFYHLFEAAEDIKKQFFLEKGTFEIDLGIGIKNETNARKAYRALDKWKMFYYEEEKLMPLMQLDIITLYLYEIHGLLRADIYSLMKQFIESFYISGEIMDYNLIKLTGQSCQVDLFKEALKEFIPGRLIQNKKNYSELEDIYQMKLSCISGALHYLKGKELGYMNIQEYYESAAFPYTVVAYTHENKEKILIESLQKEEETRHISRFIVGVQVNLYLKDVRGHTLREYLFERKAEDFEETTYYGIEESYNGKIIQEETDNIINGEVKFFVWPDKENWGFYVVPILREQHKLYKGKAIFYEFEDDTWEENFFDGNK